MATAVTTLTMPRTWVVRLRGHEVDVVGEVLPDARNALDLGLTAELAFGADFARDASDLGGERVQLIDHRVDGVFQLQDFAFDVDGDLLRQIAVGDGGRDLRDVAHLAGQVRGHGVDVVGQIFPGARDALNFGLAAQLSFGADLLGDAGDFRGEGAKLIDHRVDGVFQLQNLALDVDGDLLATGRRWRPRS